MRINTAWLLDYLTTSDGSPAGVDHGRLVETLTEIGLEVEEAVDLGEALGDVKLGKITELQPLDGGMVLTSVDVGETEPISIVCGSAHPLETDWIVPVAVAPCDLPTGVKIREGKVRGEKSHGMICPDGELGLIARDTGLQHFSDESLIGKPLPEVIDIDEWLVEIAVLANRPDCLGVIGIAREIAAALDLKLQLPKIPELEFVAADAPDADGFPFRLTTKSPELCPRYLGQKLDGISVGPSPAWLTSRLQIAGSRPINNVVDITNFVLFEYGQPLHAFDFETLAGPEICVRQMGADEKLRLLDDQEIDGTHQPLVIADAKKPIALAGIMGGDSTQTTETTSTLLLEAAHFEPVQIRTMKRRHNLLTDSAYRFERGTDPNFMLSQAIARACGLLSELAGGTPVGPTVESYPEPIEPPVVTLSGERLRIYFGTNIEPDRVEHALTKLGMTVIRDSNSYSVTVPTFRVDVNDPVVLIEDVIRMVGYDAVPLEPTASGSTSGGRADRDRVKNRLAAALASMGFFECRKAPLVGSEINAACLAEPSAPIRVRNPMRVDMGELRTSLLPGLLLTADINHRRGEADHRYFEIDRVFRQTDAGPSSHWAVGGVIGGSVLERDWSGRAIPVDFYAAKGIVENLLESAGVTDPIFEPLAAPGFTAGQAATVRTSGGEALGVVGTLDPSFLPKGQIKLRGDLFGFQLDIDRLVEPALTITEQTPVPRTPAVDRDLAVLAKRQISFADLSATIRDAAGEILEELTCTDLYEGDKLPDGTRVLTIHLAFRDGERTLTTEEVTDVVQRIERDLDSKHNATLRGS